MSFATRVVNLESALEILAICRGYMVNAIVEEQGRVSPNQERIDSCRMVLRQLRGESTSLRMDDVEAIARIRFFYGLLLKKAMHAPPSS